MSEERDITRRILRCYRQSTGEHYLAGLAWYDAAFTACERLAWLHGHSVTHSVVALAHLSPRITWAKNVEHLGLLLSGCPRPQHVLTRSWNMASLSLGEAQPLDSFSRVAMKTRSFAEAILGDQNAVVVDIWSARAAGVEEDSVRSIGGYRRVADAYRRGARRVGIPARDLQAVVWCAVRGSAA